MVVLCSHCGQPLKKDDARSCHNCGSRIPVRSPGSQFLRQARDASPTEEQLNDEPLPREQITSQPLAPRDEPPRVDESLK